MSLPRVATCRTLGLATVLTMALKTVLVTALLTALLAVLVTGAAAAEPPELAIEAPPSLARKVIEVESYDIQRLEVAMRLAGLTEPGPPVRVILAPEDSEEARAAPSWVAGYALGSANTVVLFPARAPTYPDRSLESLLHHEVAHVLIDRAAQNRPVPRWFHEGVALAAGRAWNLEDRTRFAFERLRGKPVALAELETWFRSDTSRVHRAYSVSGAFVHELLTDHGPLVTGDILDGVGRGLSFPTAFERATGESLRQAQARFHSKFRGLARWLPFLTSSLVLWMVVTALALVAIWRRRRRDAELHRRWEEEERWTAGGSTRAGSDPGDGSGWVH